MRIEDYALIGDLHTAALVGNDGSIDWLCLPRFDSGACFAALLGTPEHGRWQLAPVAPIERVVRRYRPDSLVLETELHTADGVVQLVDFMPLRNEFPALVRIVEGVSGHVAMRMELTIRFDYGRVVPWVRQLDGRLHAIAGPDALVLQTSIPTRGEQMRTVADFAIGVGDRVPFCLSWHQSHRPAPDGLDPLVALESTDVWWREWAGRCKVGGDDRDATVRSLITLKALTYAPTGGIVAAPTTSLPETLGGERNWDYRYCWLRDATLTLFSMLHAGYVEEATAWRDWLLRAVAGDPAQLQIMYGPAGERRLEERTLDWLPGYEGSRPVRIGNAAVNQLQLDVYGEVVDALHQARRAGIPADEASWALERSLLDWLESGWRQPDEGIWEVRGPRRHFTHSKVMAWVAMDRAVKSVEQQACKGAVDKWRRARAEIHAEVCAQGYDATVGAFTQSFGDKALDASTLLIPTVGFLPVDDPRVAGTIAAIERDLMRDGFVLRYLRKEEQHHVDGLHGKEGAFLACSFWLVDALAACGRRDDARALFDRLLAIRNDVGLLAEEYDVDRKRLVGNFPQAFSHVALVNSALELANHRGPASRRRTT